MKVTVREQLRHTADFHQLGDPCYYYFLSWASPPISLYGFNLDVSGVNITDFYSLGNNERNFLPNIDIRQNASVDMKHELV